MKPELPNAIVELTIAIRDLQRDFQNQVRNYQVIHGKFTFKGIEGIFADFI